MIAWLLIHWTDVLFHLGLDLSGGFSLKCAMGACKHPEHQYLVWVTGAIFLSILTVYVVG